MKYVSTKSLNKLFYYLIKINFQFQTLRKVVHNYSYKLNNMRHENRQLTNLEKDKLLALENGITELGVLSGKLDKFKNNNLDAQDRLKQIEELLESETKNMKTLEDETNRLNGVVFRSEQQLFKLQEAEKFLKVL